MAGETVSAAPTSALPVWLLGAAYAPVGIGCSIAFVVIPQLLAAQNVPAPLIASLTAFAVAPGFAAFLFGPLIDWRFRRKSYAIFFYLLGALGLVMCLYSTANLAALAFGEFAAQLAITIGCNAVGGWFSGLVPKHQSGRLGAWFSVWNIGAGGATTMVAVPILRAFPYSWGVVLLGLWAALAVLLLIFLPCKSADKRLAHESVKAFAGDVAAILKAPIVRWTLLIFLVPAASFALTNVVGGLGADFHTPEASVSLIIGIGAIAAGIGGSLLTPLLERWLSPRFLYLGLGLVGAIGTALIAVLPREIFAFALSVLHENIFQAAAFSVCYAIILRTVGPDDPLAATQFSLLQSAFCLPLTYMQMADAQGLAMGGVTGAFLMDAGLSAAASLILLAVFWRWRKVIPAG